MYACRYICMYVGMYVCMYVCMCNPSLVWEIRLLKVVVWWVVVVKCYGVEPEKQEAETKMLK